MIDWLGKEETTGGDDKRGGLEYIFEDLLGGVYDF